LDVEVSPSHHSFGIESINQYQPSKKFDMWSAPRLPDDLESQGIYVLEHLGIELT
jgi:hypothetical protein